MLSDMLLAPAVNLCLKGTGVLVKFSDQQEAPLELSWQV